MQEGPYRNTLLRHLDPASIKRLKLKHTTLDVRLEILPPNGHIKNLYFVEEGIASMTNVFKNGNEVEVGAFGFDSVVGFSALLGAKLSPTRAFMQMGGHGYLVSVAAAQAEFDRSDTFRRLLLKHVQAQYAQATQMAACNAVHKYEQRMSRWLLMCSHRVSRDTLELSHEFLAHMMGSTRSTVTLTMGALRRKSLIEYSRGCIRILDRKKLERQACECYAVTKMQLEALENGRD